MNNQGLNFHFQNSYEELPLFFYTKTNLNPAPAPRLVQWNQDLAEELGLGEPATESKGLAEVLSASLALDGASLIAQAYAGHQFGQFTLLGDGRALLLGEHLNPQGERLDIQFKGSGPTRYSRSGDGRASLGPMLREYLISEAMHGLGIATSRSLAVVETGEQVMRECPLAGAVLTRIASSHIRVGTFQYARAFGSDAEVKELVDYTIKRHDPDLLDQADPYEQFLLRVIDRQAETIAKWQLVGFVHGVMNTDNMTISGETIDYGPCAFLDAYDPTMVFSSIDDLGRYAYGNQPYIGKWNLTRFAETLLSLFHEDSGEAVKIAEELLSTYDLRFTEYFLKGMRHKLGLVREEAGDADLIHQLLGLLEQYKLDYTNFFLDLTRGEKTSFDLEGRSALAEWLKAWQARVEREGRSSREVQEFMQEHNPALIPRNYYVEAALTDLVEKGDARLFNELFEALKDPFAHNKEQEKFQDPPPMKGPYRTFCGT